MSELRSDVESLDLFTPSEERASIVENVFRSGDDELIDLLLDHLDGMILDEGEYRMILDLARDEAASAETRAHAAIALGPALELWEMERDDPFPMGEEEFSIDPELAAEIHRSLLEIVRNEQEPTLVRRRAFEAAVRCVSDEHDKLIRRFWIDPDRDWRLTAMFAMGQSTFYEKEVLSAVENDELDPVVRGQAFQSAAGLELKKVKQRAKRIAADPGQPEELRAGALIAYAKLAPTASQDLLEQISEEESGEIRELAEALLELEDSLDW